MAHSKDKRIVTITNQMRRGEGIKLFARCNGKRKVPVITRDQFYDTLNGRTNEPEHIETIVAAWNKWELARRAKAKRAQPLERKAL